jgi:aminoglycoside 6'-N-acetyltransferase I
MKIEKLSDQHMAEWRDMRRKLYSGTIEYAFPEKEIDWILGYDHYECFVVMDDDHKVIGFMELSLRNIVEGCIGGPVGYIEGLYLKPNHRGKGYGKQLLTEAGIWFKEHGCTEMATDTETKNIKAQRFYKEAGFKEMWHAVQFKKKIDS